MNRKYDFLTVISVALVHSTINSMNRLTKKLFRPYTSVMIACSHASKDVPNRTALHNPAEYVKAFRVDSEASFQNRVFMKVI
jgi:hypothetical protein